MILSIGIDLIEISRIAGALERLGTRFRDRVFTPAEIEYCEGQASAAASYAARFAAKEAVMKAIGEGWFDGVKWKDIEVIRPHGGRPSIKLAGRAKDSLSRAGACTTHLSLSHSRGLAIAQVVIETSA